MHSVRAACGRKVLFGWYRRLRDWVDSYHCCSYGRSADLNFLSGSLRSGTFRRAFHTDAPPLSSTGHVVLARPASLNFVALHSEEPLKDQLIPHISSTNGVHGNFALCLTKGVVASTDWSRMIRIRARRVWLAIPFGQSGRAHVLAPESIGSRNPPTNLAYGSEAAVVVDEGALRDLAGHGTDLFCSLPRCTDSDTKTRPFTMPMLTLTERGRMKFGSDVALNNSFKVRLDLIFG